MNIKRLARWVTAIAVAGAFVIGSAHLALPIALQVEEQDPGFRGPRAHGRPGFRGGPEGGFMHWRMLRELNLTEEQKEQLKALRKEHIENTKVQREDFIKARKAFRQAIRELEDGVGSEEAVQVASQDLADAQAALAVARSSQRPEFLSILTEEQQKKFEELRAEMEAFRKERIERRKNRRKDLQQDGPLHQRL